MDSKNLESIVHNDLMDYCVKQNEVLADFVDESAMIDSLLEATDLSKERKAMIKKAAQIATNFVRSKGIKLNSSGGFLNTINKQFKKGVKNYFELQFSNVGGDFAVASLMNTVCPIIITNAVSSSQIPKLRYLFKNDKGKEELQKILDTQFKNEDFKATVGEFYNNRTSLRIYVTEKK